MTQPTTSILAYNDMMASGKIHSKCREVAQAFITYGPGTSKEVLTAAGLGGNLNLMRARVVDLANAGIIVASDHRRCKLSGRPVMVWQFVGIHGKPRRRKPSAAKWRELAIEAVEIIGRMDAPVIHKFLADKLRELDGGDAGDAHES